MSPIGNWRGVPKPANYQLAARFEYANHRLAARSPQSAKVELMRLKTNNMQNFRSLKNLNYPLSILLFLTLFSSKLSAQFHFNGAAKPISARCFQLTDERLNIVGSLWDTTKISLLESFDVNLDLFFGCLDGNGADGIVFGFQPVSTSIGRAGQGIGFEGVQPSIGIEMDTYQNNNLNDPPFDHVAIVRNGDMNHGSTNTVAGPVSIGTSGNIEDCKQHNVRVKWDAAATKLDVFIDCQLKVSYTNDIVNTIFNGDPNVFWGFTAATGGLLNRHEVCFKFTTLLDKPTKLNLCRGDTVQLQAYGGETYRWTPAAGLNNPTISNPIAKPDTTTTYTVISKGACGVENQKDIRIVVNGDPILFDLGRDTNLCKGQILTLDASLRGAQTYEWSTGSRDSTITVRQSGVYSALLKRSNCTATDTIKVRFLEPPTVALGSDTTLCYYKKLVLTVSAENGRYQWQDGSYLPKYPVLKTGFYSVTAINQCGVANGLIYVNFKDCHALYAPNIFSPNGDVTNDVFFIYSENIKKINTFSIYNRWGGNVFTRVNALPNNPLFGWNGEQNGKPLPADVYTWYAEIEFTDGETLIKKGDVMLIR